jgi:hypothetical protein
MRLNENVWLPYLKFTLQTIAITYPKNPNNVTKKKYYDFIQNIPILFPLYPMGSNFVKLLDKFPVTPYLDSRMSFMKWIYFIFNKIDIGDNKPETTFYESLERYYEKYKPKELLDVEKFKKQERYIQFGIGVSLLLLIMYFYKK